jgi:hypothetical protein
VAIRSRRRGAGRGTSSGCADLTGHPPRNGRQMRFMGAGGSRSICRGDTVVAPPPVQPVQAAVPELCPLWHKPVPASTPGRRSHPRCESSRARRSRRRSVSGRRPNSAAIRRVPAPGGLGHQGGTDDLGGLCQPSWHQAGSSTRLAPHELQRARLRAYRPRRPITAADPRRLPSRPRPQRCGATRAGQPPGGQIRLGLLDVEHDDHDGVLLSRAEAFPPHRRLARVNW